jgi:hypothetical protein
MKPRGDAPRRVLLALVYSAGLVSAAFGALLIVDARSARTTDVGAITGGLEMLVGLVAAMFGAGALLAAGVAEYSTRKPRSTPAPEYLRPEDRAARSHGARRGQPLDPNGGFHDVTKIPLWPPAIYPDGS